MVAARWAVLFAKEIGLQQCHFEGDLEIVIKVFKMVTFFPHPLDI